MTQPVFVKTRHEYDSYRDFWRLVAVSGFETCYVDEVKPFDPGRCYIVLFLNNEWPVDLYHSSRTYPRARIIHWNLEWFDDAQSYPLRYGIRETWTADRAHALRANLQYVPVGSHLALRDKGYSASKKEYDVAMLSYLSPRRSNIHNQLEAAGLRLAPNVGPQHGRHDVLLKTRCVLHVHQTTSRTVSPLRLAVAAAYGLPVLSENCDDPGIYAEAVPFADGYTSLVDHVLSWLEWGALDDYAKSLHYLLCKTYMFRDCVEAAL